MMKFRSSVIACVCALVGFAAAAGVPVPVRTGSVYGVGETPQFELDGRTPVAYSVRDYFGRTVADGTVSPDAAGVVSLPPAKALGHFTVTLGDAQTAYAVLPPEPARRDPFFMIDKNYADPDLCRLMKRNGFGALFILPPGSLQAITLSDERLEAAYRSLEKGHRTGFLATDEFVLRAAADPAVKYNARTEGRLKEGLAPVSDDDLRKIRRHFTRVADLLKDRVTDWIVQEEFDYVRDAYRANTVNYLSSYALIARNASLGLRAGNPSARISVLGICCYDYYWAPAPFLYSKIVLDSLRGVFDCVAIDAYSGNWNGVRGLHTPPEESFRRLLTDAAKLSADYGGSNEVVNAERCASVEYSAPFDSPICRSQADCTARAMIINRSVTNSPCYSLHLLAIPIPADQYAAKPSRRDISDLGIWKTLRTARGYRHVPRPAVAAVGTVARKLAFVSSPRHLAETDGLYAEVFTRPDGSCVAALWTPGETFSMRLDLPSCVETDLMGVERQVAGPTDLPVSTSPVFLEAANRALLEKAIAARRVTKSAETKAAEAAVALPRAPAEGEKIVLSVPGNVWPSSAMMPEYGFVKTGPEAPRAEVSLSWTDEGLHVAGEVFNKRYIRRSETGATDQDDTMVVEIAPAGAEKSYGDRRILKKTFAATGGTATGAAYAGLVPWSELGSDFAPGAGARVRLNVRFPLVPRLSDVKAPYCLTWCVPGNGFTEYAKRFVPNSRLLELTK